MCSKESNAIVNVEVEFPSRRLAVTQGYLNNPSFSRVVKHLKCRLKCRRSRLIGPSLRMLRIYVVDANEVREASSMWHEREMLNVFLLPCSGEGQFGIWQSAFQS